MKPWQFTCPAHSVASVAARAVPGDTAPAASKDDRMTLPTVPAIPRASCHCPKDSKDDIRSK